MILEWASNHMKVKLRRLTLTCSEAYRHVDYPPSWKMRSYLLWWNAIGLDDEVNGACSKPSCRMDILLSLCQQAPTRNINCVFWVLGALSLKGNKKEVGRFLTFKSWAIDLTCPLKSSNTSRRLQRFMKVELEVVFVSLGCPKQEYWMNQNKGKSSGVIGLGGFSLFWQEFIKGALMDAWIRIKFAS